jgi:hypothetical protein
MPFGGLLTLFQPFPARLAVDHTGTHFNPHATGRRVFAVFKGMPLAAAHVRPNDS